VASLVEKFQKDALDSTKSVTDILRTAKVVSAKLGLNDIEEWIAAELNGYPDLESTPDYRRAGGVLQAQNPYYGWMTVGSGSLDRMSFKHPIPQIEEFSKQETICFEPEPYAPLAGAYASVPQRVAFSGIVFKGMLDVVRDRLLEWSLELEKRRITGDNMSFDEHEKQAAHSQVFHIQHVTGIVGNVTDSNVNVYDFGSINQQLKQWNVPQSERNDLENIIDALKSSRPEEKPSLIEKGKAWIVRNSELIGAGASIIRKALGIPDVA
jgi:AbiTii